MFGSTKDAVNRLLHAVEHQSKRYGMKLNRDKCEVIKTNTKASIAFADKQKLKVSNSATNSLNGS